MGKKPDALAQWEALAKTEPKKVGKFINVRPDWWHDPEERGTMELWANSLVSYARRLGELRARLR